MADNGRATTWGYCPARKASVPADHIDPVGQPVRLAHLHAWHQAEANHLGRVAMVVVGLEARYLPEFPLAGCL